MRARNLLLPLITLLAVGFALLAAAPASAQGGAKTRPIEDFVAAQGTFCLDDGSGG